MRRFVVQAVASVLVLAGLALLGLGPRAAAGMLYHAGPDRACGLGGEDSGLVLAVEPPEGRSEASPSFPPKDIPFSCLDLPYRFLPSEGTGGTGSSSNPTSSPEGHMGLVAGGTSAPPPLTALLPFLNDLFIPDPILSSLFRPPRCTVRA